MIQTSVNEKRYIGSAVNFRRRKSAHWSTLNKGCHPNRHLQRHVNKYGIEVLSFSVLERCNTGSLIEREQYYLDTLKPEFNGSPTAGSPLGFKHSEEAKQKINEKKSSNSKITYQYNKNTGALIAEFSTITEAAKSISKNISSMHSSISRCACGKIKSAGGFIWSFEKKTVIEIPEYNYNGTPKKVYQYDKNTGILIAKFNSVIEAAKSMSENISSAISSIAGCARGRGKSAYGHYWSYTRHFLISN